MTQTNLDETRNNVLQKLRTGEATVRFTKVDGTERTMRCTLVEASIPADKRPKSGMEETSDSKVVGSAVRAFDLDKGEWRSFRLDSIISF